jgi:ABC-2 type transport system permease protein
MAYRSVRKLRRTPEQFFDVLIQPILFTLLFTYVFGGAIAGGVKSYLPLLIPGILVQTVITTSTVTGVQLREDMEKGVFNRFRSLPIARIAPLAGALLADLIRYGVATLLTILTAYVIGYRPDLIGIIFSSLFVVLVAWCMSWIFAFFGVVGRSAASVQSISMLVLFPLTFLSNAFVPMNTLPAALQIIAKVNPVTYLVSTLRQLANEGTIGPDFWLTLLGASLTVLIFVPLTVKMYMRKS